MHHVPASHPTQRFHRLKHSLIANGTIVLQFLRDAHMIVIFLNINAGIAPHAMTEINPETLAFPTYVAVGTVVYILFFVIVVEVADGTHVFGKRRSFRFTCLVDAFGTSGLQSPAFHTQQFRNFLPVQHGEDVVGRFVGLPNVLAAKAAGEHLSRFGVAQFAIAGVVAAAWDHESLAFAEGVGGY